EMKFIRVSGRPTYATDGTRSGAVIVFSDITPLRKAERDQLELIERLQQALREIKTLHGLIPICAQCKKIRNDDGAWERLESYMSAHTEAEFTHGICSDCGMTLYGERWQQVTNDRP